MRDLAELVADQLRAAHRGNGPGDAGGRRAAPPPAPFFAALARRGRLPGTTSRVMPTDERLVSESAPRSNAAADPRHAAARPRGGGALRRPLSRGRQCRSGRGCDRRGAERGCLPIDVAGARHGGGHAHRLALPRRAASWPRRSTDERRPSCCRSRRRAAGEARLTLTLPGAAWPRAAPPPASPGRRQACRRWKRRWPTARPTRRRCARCSITPPGPVTVHYAEAP